MSNVLQQDILNDYAEPAKAAGIGKRIGAAIIDGIILGLLFYALSFPFGYHYHQTETSVVTTTPEGGKTETSQVVTTSSGMELTSTGNLLYFVGWLLLMVVQEGITGQTIGKRVVGVKVIRQNGDPGNFGTSLIRHLLDIVDLILLIGLIVATSNPLHKRIGDMAAGTYVVDKV